MSLLTSGQATARAVALIDIGRSAEALPLLHQAIAQDPNDQNARCLLSLALYREGDYLGAETAAREAIAVAPGYARGYSLRALALKALGRTLEALPSARRGVELDPNSPERYDALIQVALASHTDLAQEAAETLLRLAPESASAHFRAGTVPMFREEYREAEAFMRRALAIDPTFAAAHNNLGVTLLHQGKRAEALDAFQRAATLNPGDQIAAKNIRALARQQKFPLPSWARRPFLWGPGIVVALVQKVRYRHDLDALPKAARREVTRWTREDVARVAVLVVVGTAATVWVGIVATSLITAGLHPSVASPTAPSQVTVPLPGTPQAVCAVSQTAALIDAIGTGFTPAQTIYDLQALSTDAGQIAQLTPSGSLESRDLSAISADATSLITALQATPAVNVASDQDKLQTDSAALRIAAGCSPT